MRCHQLKVSRPWIYGSLTVSASFLGKRIALSTCVANQLPTQKETTAATRRIPIRRPRTRGRSIGGPREILSIQLSVGGEFAGQVQPTRANPYLSRIGRLVGSASTLK
jgi:hypothetical protein